MLFMFDWTLNYFSAAHDECAIGEGLRIAGMSVYKSSRSEGAVLWSVQYFRLIPH